MEQIFLVSEFVLVGYMETSLHSVEVASSREYRFTAVGLQHLWRSARDRDSLPFGRQTRAALVERRGKKSLHKRIRTDSASELHSVAVDRKGRD
jgi:hypothetical protein